MRSHDGSNASPQSHRGDCYNKQLSNDNCSSIISRTSSVTTNSDLLSIEKNKKSVHFNNVEIYLFQRSQGFNVVPKYSGTSLGMVDNHHEKQEISIEEFEKLMRKKRRKSCFHRQISHKSNKFKRKYILHNSSKEKIEKNEGSSYSGNERDIKCFELSSQISNNNDDDKTFYNSLKPLSSKMRERILKSAGVALDQSEILENNEIRSRRKSCGCNCIQCEPETCYCTLTGINCQVDEPQFPCSCAKSCNNPYGRIAFRSSLVRIHHQQTLKRLKASQKREETPARFFSNRNGISRHKISEKSAKLQ